MSNEFGIRGLIPRYKLGRYGPHSKDALFASPPGLAEVAALKMHNIRHSDSMTRIQLASQPLLNARVQHCQQQTKAQLDVPDSA